MSSQRTAEQFRTMAAAARATGDLTQAARYEYKARSAPGSVDAAADPLLVIPAEWGVAAALVILDGLEGTAHVRSQIEDLGDLDGLGDLVLEAINDLGAWTPAERALLTPAGALASAAGTLNADETYLARRALAAFLGE